MILILFLVLLLCYLAAFLGAEQRKDSRVLGAWWIASLAVAIASSGVMLYILFASEPSHTAAQIAWIGIGTRRAEDALELGGSRQKTGIGWPNGAFSPALTIQTVGPTEANLQISRGGGFVRGPQGFLNGTPLPESAKTSIDSYSLEVGSLPSRLCISCRVSIRISDSAGKRVAEIKPRVGGDIRVASLYSNLSVDIARLRKNDGPAAAALEAWSANLRLLLARSGLRILDREAEAVSAEVSLPSQLTVYWPGQSQPVELTAARDGRVQATFLPALEAGQSAAGSRCGWPDLLNAGIRRAARRLCVPASLGRRSAWLQSDSQSQRRRVRTPRSDPSPIRASGF